MAQQLKLSTGGQVIPTALHLEMRQSYLEYAMSVIVGRALPDVRDGLKPVHRRILYAMQELGLTPDRPYRKCARVVGDVLGKYHPHGDQSVYDALVRMVQDFNSRYPLLAGHGNFGSVDNDPPAAMRYTETRLAAIAHEAILAEIDRDTVDFGDNFDNSQQEPLVLPAALPILLLNGASGIAVGMATNIPPHNLGEIIDGLIALIDQPDLSEAKLFGLIPGPDFPTGGQIVNPGGIQEVYRRGRGSIPVQGIASLETIQSGRGSHRRTALVITELPYQVNKAAWIEKVADLVNQGRLSGIADLRDESDREGMRVVVELKRETNPQQLLQQLYKLTPLQVNFGAIFLALVDGQPLQLSLRQLLQAFLDFRETTLSRRYSHDLAQAENRAHVVAGLLLALEHIDTIINILRQCPDGTTAKVALQGRLSLSDRQADAILAMPLRRLTGLEHQSLRQEYETLQGQIEELQRLLGDRSQRLKALKQDLRRLKRRYADPRRTRIPRAEERVESSDQLAMIREDWDTETETALSFTYRGYVQRRSLGAFERRQHQQEQGFQVQTLGDMDDFGVWSQRAKLGEEVLILTRQGRAYTLGVRDIPPTAGRARGTPLISLLPVSAQGDREAIAAQLVLTAENTAAGLILVSQQGGLKRLPLEDFTHLTGRGLTAWRFKDQERLQTAQLAQRGDQVVLATSTGRVLRFDLEDQVPWGGRTRQGLSLVRLNPGERLVGGVTLAARGELFLLTARGYGKRFALGRMRALKRGALGIFAFQFTTKTDALVGLVAVRPGAKALCLTTAHRMIQVPVEEVGLWGKDGPGDRCIKLPRDEQVVEVLAGS